MKYSEREVKFLCYPFGAEQAAGTRRAIPAAIDLRTLGCPANVFERILDDRARKLGRTFVEFRRSSRTTTTPKAGLSLAGQIEAQKPF